MFVLSLAVLRPGNVAWVSRHRYTELIALLLMLMCLGNKQDGVELADPPSQIHEKDLLALKKAVLNSWTAWFTECRWETKMVAFGYLIVWNSGVHISERNNQWATHLFVLDRAHSICWCHFLGLILEQSKSLLRRIWILQVWAGIFHFILLCTMKLVMMRLRENSNQKINGLWNSFRFVGENL